MPSPPKLSGEHTRDQWTRHLPPHTLSEPAHKNARWSLSICLITHFGWCTPSRRKMGMAERTNLASTILPMEEIHLAFQEVIFLINLSINSWKPASLNLLADKGIPRYVQGKLDNWQLRANCKGERSSPSHRIGKILLLDKLVMSPVALPNSLNTFVTTSKSCNSGFKKMITSSAYNSLPPRFLKLKTMPQGHR